MEFDLNRFRVTFFQEAAEHLETMETTLLALTFPFTATEPLHAIFRCAHSMKAGAGMFGYQAIARFTHALESLLDRLRNGGLKLAPEHVELLLRSVDIQRALVESASKDSEEAPAGMEKILGELAAACEPGYTGDTAREVLPSSAPESTIVAEGEAEFKIRFVPLPGSLSFGLDPLLVLRDLANLGRVLTVKAEVSRLPALDALDPEECCLGWTLRLRTGAGEAAVRDVFAFYEGQAEICIEGVGQEVQSAQPVARAAHGPGIEASIRVATQKVDRLIDLAGELVIAHSMATEIMAGFTAAKLPLLVEAMAEMARHTHELQDRAMRIRMLPVGTIFCRFPRMVHDTAPALGKRATLAVSGEETELDKGMVDRLADPLTHLVRNAVDHGLETPEERRAAGKPEEGLVELKAYYQSGSVIVEVCDDGRGLNTARIRAKGIERGLIAPGDELTTDEIHALIFRPGFSTVDRVTDLSGRGVGMDVVKKAVESMNGFVSVESHAARGTTFRIKLPLTLAIVDALLLRVGAHTYVLPLTAIIESMRPRREQICSLAGKGEIVVVRQEPLPLLRLHRLFGIEDAESDPERGLVVIVEHGGRRLCLLVDEILGQQQVVVKSLEANYRRVEGITGATILGDGRASLILDVAGIVEASRGSRVPATAA